MTAVSSESGIAVNEMNAVRKHLSLLKGGLLAKLASPARVVSLILSDVVGDDLDVIGSGPTAPDSSTFQSALAVLDNVLHERRAFVFLNGETLRRGQFARQIVERHLNVCPHRTIFA